MKKIALTITLGAILANGAMGAGELTGDAKLACEAILCLSSHNKPKECNPALNRYYSIKHKKAHKQAKARKNFLKLCPKQ